MHRIIIYSDYYWRRWLIQITLVAARSLAWRREGAVKRIVLVVNCDE